MVPQLVEPSVRLLNVGVAENVGEMGQEEQGRTGGNEIRSVDAKQGPIDVSGPSCL